MRIYAARSNWPRRHPSRIESKRLLRVFARDINSCIRMLGYFHLSNASLSALRESRARLPSMEAYWACVGKRGAEFVPRSMHLAVLKIAVFEGQLADVRLCSKD